MKKLLRILLVIIILGGGWRLISDKTDRFASKTSQTGIANPASENCIAKGGKLEMRENKKGQYGICFFEDNRQCEERALYREDCPVGGMKVTGYLTEGEVYCAISGGEVIDPGSETPMCKRVDGTICNAQANLDGDCPNPYDPNPDAGNGPDI